MNWMEELEREEREREKEGMACNVIKMHVAKSAWTLTEFIQ